MSGFPGFLGDSWNDPTSLNLYLLFVSALAHRLLQRLSYHFSLRRGSFQHVGPNLRLRLQGLLFVGARPIVPVVLGVTCVYLGWNTMQHPNLLEHRCMSVSQHPQCLAPAMVVEAREVNPHDAGPAFLVFVEAAWIPSGTLPDPEWHYSASTCILHHSGILH